MSVNSCPTCGYQIDRVEWLTAEIERLRAHYADEQQRLFHYERVIADQDKRCDRLEAEIERLRATLRQIVKRYETAENGWPAEDMREVASTALEQSEPKAEPFDPVQTDQADWPDKPKKP